MTSLRVVASASATVFPASIPLCSACQIPSPGERVDQTRCVPDEQQARFPGNRRGRAQREGPDSNLATDRRRIEIVALEETVKPPAYRLGMTPRVIGALIDADIGQPLHRRENPPVAVGKLEVELVQAEGSFGSVPGEIRRRRHAELPRDAGRCPEGPAPDGSGAVRGDDCIRAPPPADRVRAGDAAVDLIAHQTADGDPLNHPRSGDREGLDKSSVELLARNDSAGLCIGALDAVSVGEDHLGAEHRGVREAVEFRAGTEESSPPTARRGWTMRRRRPSAWGTCAVDDADVEAGACEERSPPKLRPVRRR